LWKDFPFYIMKKTSACSVHIFCPFHRSFIVDRQLVFVPNTAVVLRDNARVTTCNCCVVLNSACIYVEKNGRVTAGVFRGNNRFMLDCIGVLEVTVE
jgi:hypothetical protein